VPAWLTHTTTTAPHSTRVITPLSQPLPAGRPCSSRKPCQMHHTSLSRCPVAVRFAIYTHTHSHTLHTILNSPLSPLSPLSPSPLSPILCFWTFHRERVSKLPPTRMCKPGCIEQQLALRQVTPAASQPRMQLCVTSVTPQQPAGQACSCVLHVCAVGGRGGQARHTAVKGGGRQGRTVPKLS
jgi:hypothetical protein